MLPLRHEDRRTFGGGGAGRVGERAKEARARRRALTSKLHRTPRSLGCPFSHISGPGPSSTLLLPAALQHTVSSYSLYSIEYHKYNIPQI